jgi:hypothetical protein
LTPNAQSEEKSKTLRPTPTLKFLEKYEMHRAHYRNLNIQFKQKRKDIEGLPKISTS